MLEPDPGCVYFDIGTIGWRTVETKICCLIFLAGNITTLSHGTQLTPPQVFEPTHLTFPHNCVFSRHPTIFFARI